MGFEIENEGMMKMSSVAAMRAMDRQAIEQWGIPELLLMEHAGMAATQVLVRHYPVQGARWVVLCGVGNNGGDGLVVARLLYSRGAEVAIWLLGDATRFGEAAAANLAIVRQMGLPIETLQPTNSTAALTARLASCDGIVDGLLGTGITRPLEGLLAQVVEAVNGSGTPTVSLDIPSGVQGDTGCILGTAICASHTITFGLPKIGNLLYPGYAQGGTLWVSHIGFPPALYADQALPLATNEPVLLPPRAVAGHKGTFGDTLFVAGAGAYYGAPYFAATAFMKAGGGYGRLATPPGVAAVVAGRTPELVFLPQQATQGGSIARENRERLLEAAAGVDFVVMGPGTSLDAETQELLRDLTAGVEKPLLLDGDAITAVSQAHALVRNRTAPTVITPHLGELARLSGLERADIQADPVGTLQRLCADLHAVIVMKGAHSCIGYPDGRVFVNLSGNAGMATAGSGDVLTGTIAAMAGLGLGFDEAVRMGVFVHGVAGDLAAAAVGQDGMTAEDVLAALPEAVARCRRLDDPWMARYRVQEVDSPDGACAGIVAKSS
jgi:NAD(P)H-hydrate epimerase